MLCPKSKPLRDKRYCESARHRRCDVPTCYAVGEEFGVVLAHINVAGNFGMRRKASDDESIFLCREHHDEFDSRILTSDRDRALWLVRNIMIPLRKGAYQRWRMETGR